MSTPQSIRETVERPTCMVSETTKRDLEKTIKRLIEERESLYRELEILVLGKAQGHSSKQADSLKKWLHEAITRPINELTPSQLGVQVKFYTAAPNDDLLELSKEVVEGQQEDEDEDEDEEMVRSREEHEQSEGYKDYLWDISHVAEGGGLEDDNLEVGRASSKSKSVLDPESERAAVFRTAPRTQSRALEIPFQEGAVCCPSTTRAITWNNTTLPYLSMHTTHGKSSMSSSLSLHAEMKQDHMGASCHIS